MKEQADDPYESSGSAAESHNAQARGCRGCLVPALALFFTFLSFMSSRADSWDEVTFLRFFNFLVIAPLWAATAYRHFEGKVRVILAIAAFLLPATMLSMLQTAVLAAREARPPGRLTSQRMYHTFERIQTYMKAHRQAPPSLAALPPESAGMTVDEWGRELQYSVDADGVITLTILRADRQPGGERCDAEIVMRYRTRNADRSLNVDEENWLEKAKIEQDGPAPDSGGAPVPTQPLGGARGVQGRHL